MTLFYFMLGCCNVSSGQIFNDVINNPEGGIAVGMFPAGSKWLTDSQGKTCCREMSINSCIKRRFSISCNSAASVNFTYLRLRNRITSWSFNYWKRQIRQRWFGRFDLISKSPEDKDCTSGLRAWWRLILHIASNISLVTPCQELFC